MSNLVHGGLRVTIVDLNNFAYYPTIGVGLFAAILRKGGHTVSVVSPLSVGVKGFARARRTGPLGHVDAMARFATAWSSSAAVRNLRARAARLVRPDTKANERRILERFQQNLSARPDVVLISAYTMFAPVVQAMAQECRQRDIPLLVGGSYLNEPSIARDWMNFPGVTAIVAAEPELFLSDLVESAARREPLDRFAGVWQADRPSGEPGPPLQQLDSLPFADYSDFPWHLYPEPVVPLITGRGCGWGVCTFCSDVTTTAGRGFRTRSAANVLEEIGHQRVRHNASLFVILDLKLNSDLGLWRGLIEGMPHRAPGARWTASVHVGNEKENGLSREELRAAHAAGLVRITTGLESGSQRVLNAMAKGVRLHRMSQFIKDASDAGISVRTTVITGYPGETSADLRKTAEFLAAHRPYIERVMINRFVIAPGARFHQRLRARPGAYPGIRIGTADKINAVIPHDAVARRSVSYWGALWTLLSAANRINRKELSASARCFEGVL